MGIRRTEGGGHFHELDPGGRVTEPAEPGEDKLVEEVTESSKTRNGRDQYDKSGTEGKTFPTYDKTGRLEDKEEPDEDEESNNEK